MTDKDLNILAEGPVIAVHQSDELLNKMSEWCVKTHTANGLVERVKAANSPNVRPITNIRFF